MYSEPVRKLFALRDIVKHELEYTESASKSKKLQEQLRAIYLEIQIVRERILKERNEI